MRYMLVNTSPGNLQIDLHSPDKSYLNTNLNRPGPVISLSLGKGSSIDILKYFDGSIEKAHAVMKYSRDVLKLMRPDALHAYISDDEGNQLDPDKLLAGLKENADFGEATPAPPTTSGEGEDGEDGEGDEGGELGEGEDGEGGESGEGEGDEGGESGEGENGEGDEGGESGDEDGESDDPSDDLTALSGVGDATAEKLHASGYTTYQSLLDADLDALIEVVGSKSSAKKIQKQVKKLVG